ncbi:MAG TPA: DPP IV N-terminal domain-containing protein, partial [Chloroflexia bacterium]|nr:DPP IV N-terminal domain-containing protein [Chloroflexia bacterium]
MADNKNPQQRRNVEIEDLYRFRLVSDPQVSSDGRTVAYVQTRLRKKKNDYAANIWLVPADGSGEPYKLTNSARRDMSPRWSPAGEDLAFISTRSGKSQIWIIRVEGGEARQLTRIKRGVGEIEWSPDGQWIAFTSEVDNDLDKKIAEEAKSKGGKQADGGSSSDSENREPGGTGEEGFVAMQTPTDWAEDDDEDEDEKEPEDKGEHAKVFTRLHIKSDGLGLDERRSHLFVVPAKGGKPRQLTEGDFDVQALRWSPDGKQLAFVSNQDPEADYHNIQDIFVVPIENGEAGEMRRVTGHDHAIGGISWLPTGDGFAIFAHRRINEAALATTMRVWTVSLEGEVRVLTEDFDRPAGSWVNSDLRSSTGPLRPLFSADGATIYFSATNGGAAQIFSVPLQGGEVKEVVVGERQVLSFDVAADGLVFSATTATHPNDIYRADFDGGNERALTDVNRDVLGELA